MCNITRWDDPLIASLNPGARWASRALSCCTTETPTTLVPAVTCPAVLVTRNAAICHISSSGSNNGGRALPGSSTHPS